MTGRLRVMASGVCHWVAVVACAGGLILAMSPAVHAEPIDGSATGPFPEVDFLHKYYDSVKYDDYFTSSSGGVWFSTPLGLNCGIWDRGAFGCSGDIRGGPPGTTNVGWVSGQIRMRYDPGFAFLVPPGRAERDLPPRTYIVYNGTTCATMADTSTFCSRGPFKFYVTPTHTLLNPP